MKTTIAVVLSLLAGAAPAVEGVGERSFKLDTTFADAAAKVQTLRSHRRLLRSQGIHLHSLKIEKFKPSFRDQSVDANAVLQANASRLGPYTLDIAEDIRLEREYAKVVFLLQRPAGQLASQRVMFEVRPDGQKTHVRMRLEMGVYVPRCCLFRRLINNVAYRRVMDEVHTLMWKAEQELIRIIREEKPDAQDSIFMLR